MVDPINMSDAENRLTELVASGNAEIAADYLRGLHPADSAELLTDLETAVQAEIVTQLDASELADVFEEMDEDDAVDIAQYLELETLVKVLDEMAPDEAADVLGEMQPEEAADLLEEMDDAEPIATLLAYDEESAGGIMNLPPPCLRRQMTVAQAITFLREHYDSEDEMFYLYVLDRHNHLIGVVNLRALVLAEESQTIEEIMSRSVITVPVEMDQEEVAQLLARYNYLALPVVDADNHLVGIVAVDDAVDVIEEEATEDIYRLAQVSSESEIFSPIPRAMRNRLPWLYVNMGTALLAASVVALFRDTIAAVAMLAAFMPIVAAQGGNAGNQGMTIVVRSLALGEMELSDAWKALRHEATLGLIHGLVLGLTVGFIAWLWQGSVILGLIIFLAMFANLIIAAIIGVLAPTTLRRLGIDPALASGVFVTATTDVMGFAIFLGLATFFLLRI